MKETSISVRIINLLGSWDGNRKRNRKVTGGTPKAQVLGWSVLKIFANDTGTNIRMHKINWILLTPHWEVPAS